MAGAKTGFGIGQKGSQLVILLGDDLIDPLEAALAGDSEERIS